MSRTNGKSELIEFDRDKKYDVVVIGSSHAYRGYDPRIFAKSGFQLYNLGTSNQTILNEYYVFNEYVEQSKNKLVLLDIYDEGFMDNGFEFEAGADMIQNMGGSDKTPFFMALSLKDFRAFNMFILRMFSKKMPAIDLNETQYVYNGYCQRTDSIKDYSEPGLITDKVEKGKLGYFKKILETALAKGITVVAVNHPTPNKNNLAKHIEFINTIQPLLAQYKVPLLDYGYSLELHPQHHYFDPTHLNQAGVDIFNEHLIKDLKKLRLIEINN